MTAAPEATEVDGWLQSEGGWWRPGRSIQEFQASPARVRWLIGGRGCAKTSSSGMEAIRHCWHYAGGKVLFVRKTEISQADTTIETVHKLFANMGPLYEDTGGLFKTWKDGRTIRLPSRKAVEAYNREKPNWETKAAEQMWIANTGARLCSFIEFRGLPHANVAEGKLRGFECSMMVMVEADLLEESDFQMASACLRWKGTDPATCDANGYILDASIIVETNPPSPRHWIAKIEEEWKRGEQPTYHFWHIATQENSHNLPPLYVENLRNVYRNNAAMYNRMVLGLYDEAYDGNPVHYPFRPDAHVGEDLPWPHGASLIVSMDAGTNNASVFSAYWAEGGTEYWHDLYELYMEASDADRQAIEILRILNTEFAGIWNNRSVCAEIRYFCDPASVNSSYTRKISVNGKQVADSAINVWRTHGINPGYQTTARGLQETIAIVNRLLQKRDGPKKTKPDGTIEETGKLVYRVDKKGCPILHRGLSGQYRYPKVGEPGYGGNEPLKGDLCGNVDHIMDAARYGKINCLRLLKAEMEATKPSNRKARRKNPNPNKRR